MTQAEIDALDWAPVESSSIDALALAEGRLYVRFRSGAIYSYDDKANPVVDSLHLALTEADSVGKVFHTLIRHPGVDFERIEIEADGD